MHLTTPSHIYYSSVNFNDILMIFWGHIFKTPSITKMQIEINFLNSSQFPLKQNTKFEKCKTNFTHVFISHTLKNPFSLLKYKW